MGEGKTLVVLGAMAETGLANQRLAKVKKGEPETQRKRERERERGRDRERGVARTAWYGE